MQEDERRIRDVLDRWWRATRDDDVDTVLGLMADDAVFLTPGEEPFGKDEFASTARNRTVQIDGDIDIEELEITDDWAWMRARLGVTMTPASGEPNHRAGHTLTIFRRQPDGGWVLARDANLLPA